VSDLIIDPVLRQARRFSRSSASSDLVEPSTSQVTPHDNNGVAIEDVTERQEATLAEANTSSNSSVSGIPLSSSPIEEEGALEAELEALDVGRSPNAAAPLPRRLLSLRPDSSLIDVDISDNPSFGIPSRFRTSATNSPAGSFSSTNNSHDVRMSPAEGPSRSSTQELSQFESANRQRRSSLPADDGMGPLRQQIKMIQASQAPSEQKARRMHQLLTEGYHHAQERSHAKNQHPAPSPISLISQERPTTPGSLSSFIWQMNGDGVTPGQQHTFQLSPDDLKRTYTPLEPPEVDENGIIDSKEKILVLGCKHYKRNVKLQCSTCDRWYTCRLCHDEVEDHVLIRKATKNMLCMLCGCAQKAGEFCVECGERSAWYYCDVCKLWDNESNKSIYHCNDCGICRKGRGLGKDFFHCKVGSF
jgi:uncharacterized CHY-type Zn-finger protein